MQHTGENLFAQHCMLNMRAHHGLRQYPTLSHAEADSTTFYSISQVCKLIPMLPGNQ